VLSILTMMALLAIKSTLMHAHAKRVAQHAEHQQDRVHQATRHDRPFCTDRPHAQSDHWQEGERSIESKEEKTPGVLISNQLGHLVESM